MVFITLLEAIHQHIFRYDGKTTLNENIVGGQNRITAIFRREPSIEHRLEYHKYGISK